jgi:hypothetical protein
MLSHGGSPPARIAHAHQLAPRGNSTSIWLASSHSGALELIVKEPWSKIARLIRVGLRNHRYHGTQGHIPALAINGRDSWLAIVA